MNTIVLTNAELVTSSAADEARKLRDELLNQAEHCKVVMDGPTQFAATNTLRELRNFFKMIEGGRETAKAPILKIGREIDALAAELNSQIEAQGKRLGAILGSYDIEQKRIAEVARQEAAREERRIREEAAAKERAETERQEKLAAQARAEVARQQAVIKAEADAKSRQGPHGGWTRAGREGSGGRCSTLGRASQEGCRGSRGQG